MRRIVQKVARGCRETREMMDRYCGATVRATSVSDTGRRLSVEWSCATPEDYKSYFSPLRAVGRHCAIMNFWLVEVLESALESRHVFTLGSECGLLRHSAMNFTIGGVYLGADFFVSASHGWWACDRRGFARGNLAYVTCLAAQSDP